MRTARLHSVLVAATLLGVPTSALASPLDGWHAGLEVRAELGLHPLRIGGGVELCKLDVTAIVDPLVVLDGQHDLDVTAGYAVGSTGWRLGGGLRPTTISVADGVHPRWTSPGEYAAFDSLGLQVSLGTASVTSELFDALDHVEPDYVVTSEAALLRSWLED